MEVCPSQDKCVDGNGNTEENTPIHGQDDCDRDNGDNRDDGDDKDDRDDGNNRNNGNDGDNGEGLIHQQV